MQLTYERRSEGFSAEWKTSVHVPPHLHDDVEIVYVTDGTVEIGVGEELFHMEKGDFAIVFPNVIHHYQVFGSEENRGIYLFFDPSLSSNFFEELQNYSPGCPVVKSKDLHEDVVNAVKALMREKNSTPMLTHAYMQIILAHVFSEMEMVDKDEVGGDNIIYRAVEYVAKKFKEEIRLEKMAFDLGISKYVLSRMFAKTFHCNFNQYVNGVRLEYAAALIENTKDSITTISYESGFESQRTFNRVFKERYKMTPRDYREQIRAIKTRSA